jgi:hypothetical protein
VLLGPTNRNGAAGLWAFSGMCCQADGAAQEELAHNQRWAATSAWMLGRRLLDFKMLDIVYILSKKDIIYLLFT